MADEKITVLPENTDPQNADFLAMVNDPSGTPSTERVTIQNLLLNRIYPVGAVYISYVSTSPATLFGGTWTQIEGRFLVALDSGDTDYDTAGETGGHKEMQQHNHDVTDPGHTHTFGAANSLSASTGAARSASAISNSTNSQTTGISIDNEGTGDSGNLPPYFTVYMWHRTA